MKQTFLTGACIFGVFTLTAEAVLLLDFVSTTFVDNINPADGSGEMRWSNIASEGGTDYDLIMTVASGSTYSPGTGPDNQIGPLPKMGPDAGTTIAEGLTRLKVQRATDVTFDFRLVQTGTSTPLDVSGFSVSFWDFDQTNRPSGDVTESLTLLGVSSNGGISSGSFTYAVAADFNVDNSNPSQPVFSSTLEGSQSDNPDDLGNLTAAQEQKVVQLTFVNASGFTAKFAVGGASSTDARTFFLGGDVPFSVPTVTTPIPEPSSALLLLPAGAMLMMRRRR